MNQTKEEKKPEGKLTTNWKKASLWVSFIGWFPFMWFVLWGSGQSATVRIIVFFIGMMLSIVGSLLSLIWINNPALWRSYDEIEDLKKDYREFKAKYQKALAEFVNNQKIDTDE